jgi:hypothetical protein
MLKVKSNHVQVRHIKSRRLSQTVVTMKVDRSLLKCGSSLLPLILQHSTVIMVVGIFDHTQVPRSKIWLFLQTRLMKTNTLALLGTSGPRDRQLRPGLRPLSDPWARKGDRRAPCRAVDQVPASRGDPLPGKAPQSKRLITLTLSLLLWNRLLLCYNPDRPLHRNRLVKNFVKGFLGFPSNLHFFRVFFFLCLFTAAQKS